MTTTCCTCASLLRDTKLPRDINSEKPLAFDRHLPCCGRIICAACQYKNPRFQSYCPFCQIASEDSTSALPRNGLRLPPAYTKTDGGHEKSLRTQLSDAEEAPPPPPYDSLPPTTPQHAGRQSSPPADTPDTVHHLSPDDTLASLSLAYAVAPQVLKQHNALFSDHLLSGRKFLLVPASHYSGPSLSTPPDPAEEERKTNIRRWMVATKCADYQVAELYLKGADGVLDVAVDAFRADEEWERKNPILGKGKDVSRRRKSSGVGGGSLTRQLF
ncbi:uncharacterized protein HMPREF1541_00495 [Cyphellophora europaea CBS 101466]|uniref:LysM domain-containing protein n=1 Tax=Cyphellophora europaea (strain CBS 101466) TaxID=1220924 RepID=W2SC58_CYPE1|nr:uncharacterized protein HMPREF1541_00495 [Cyphellophora europaea CBS 101466]ETN46311.1 hypothetical protein HMPREF1541_00495 [Cyphellophora europaea CBS 101466]